MGCSETRTFEAVVQNVPKDTQLRKYIVVRICDAEYWFYASYDLADTAQTVASEIGNGIVLLNPAANS